MKAKETEFTVRPVESFDPLSRTQKRSEAEGAPDVWFDLKEDVLPALDRLAVGDEIVVITWFHRSDRRVLKIHPRSDPRNPLTGVFATRSPDRPNPLGLHRATVRRIVKNRLRIGPVEAIDGTPVVDIKPVLLGVRDC